MAGSVNSADPGLEPRVTVRLYLQGDDAERMLAAPLADPAEWQLANVGTGGDGGTIFTPYAVERSERDASGPAAPGEPGAALRRVHEDAERWEQVTGRPAGP